MSEQDSGQAGALSQTFSDLWVTWTETAAFEPSDDPIQGARHLSERLGGWFPDEWLYGEDDLTIEFHVHRLDKSS